MSHLQVVVSVARPELFGVVFDRHYGRIAIYARRRLDDGVADQLAAETSCRRFGLAATT